MTMLAVIPPFHDRGPWARCPLTGRARIPRSYRWRCRRSAGCPCWQIVERGAEHHVNQLVVAVIHHHHRVREVRVQRVRLVDGVLAEIDCGALDLLALVIVPAGDLELAVRQRGADGLREADEFGAVQHAHLDVRIVGICLVLAVGVLGRAGHAHAVIRLDCGRGRYAQTPDMEIEQCRHDQGDGKHRADTGEYDLLAAANVTLAFRAFVIRLSHGSVLFLRDWYTD